MSLKDKERQFKKIVSDFYKKERRVFPWRHPILKLTRSGKVREPYYILVSEIMLQQTQAGARTIEKFKSFIEAFPTTKALAAASLAEVYRLWQGLGYNRRAKALRDAAIAIEARGSFPETEEELLALPGVGPYTASAILAFAFNKPVTLVETNVRTAYIHHFFPNREVVPDTELLPLIEATVDRKRPREWYSALMDYGAWLKKEHGNVSRRSKHYVRQSAFKGSNREVRGKLLKVLLEKPKLSEVELIKTTGFEKERVISQLEALQKEGFVFKNRGRYALV